MRRVDGDVLLRQDDQAAEGNLHQHQHGQQRGGPPQLPAIADGETST